MADRPILFSAPMVRAILAGTKTQTRRVVKGAPTGLAAYLLGLHRDSGMWGIHADVDRDDGVWRGLCPYGQPGDRLWVREAFCDARGGVYGRVLYRASGDAACRWHPSIHMPRACSRITLEVTGVRVERLQAISEVDAEAEGIAYSERYQGWCIDQAEHFNSSDPRESYFSLWETINGHGSVDANPWVWVVEFNRVTP